MSDSGSILDKIIESKQIQEATEFDPGEIISNLFKSLSPKERDIIYRRFGLGGKHKETLEQIGKYYEITRERIRQIESVTIKKIKELQDFRSKIEVAERNVTHLLEKHGGLMEEAHFLEKLLDFSDNNDINRQASVFMLNNLLDHAVERVKPDDDLHAGWKLQSTSLDSVRQLITEISQSIETQGQLLSDTGLVQAFKQNNFFKSNPEQFLGYPIDEKDAREVDQEITKILGSLLRISKRVGSNILGEWGLSHWTTISPKRMSDKVYLVLKQSGEPQHFTKITELINQASFDSKVAYPATVHNELILDDRFVLVGRGIYALAEWGYTPGTVIDIITTILQKEPEGLTKEEIVKRVLDQRIVRKSTIYLALTNKGVIQKSPVGKYVLVMA